MCEEVFGPVLCLVPADSVEDAVSYARSKPTPLSLYIYSGCDRFKRRVLDEIPSGNACANDCLIHFANPHIPFGGLGPSGCGAMHGARHAEQAARSART